MSDRPSGGTARVVLVQCTSAKRDAKAPAGEIYDASDYFRKQRAYAKAAGNHWFIQSAKHGLLRPETVIEPYDMRPKEIADTEAWTIEIADRIDSWVGLPATIEVLGGKKYADPLTPELETRGYDVLEPLRGQAIGERKASLLDMQNRRLEGFA